MKQLVLMEEFKCDLNEELKYYLGEKRVKSAHELAILADELINGEGKIRPRINRMPCER